MYEIITDHHGLKHEEKSEKSRNMKAEHKKSKLNLEGKKMNEEI